MKLIKDDIKKVKRTARQLSETLKKEKLVLNWKKKQPARAAVVDSNLVAFLRWNLFTYRGLWEWIDKSFDVLPKQVWPDHQQLTLF